MSLLPAFEQMQNMDVPHEQKFKHQVNDEQHAILANVGEPIQLAE